MVPSSFTLFTEPWIPAMVTTLSPFCKLSRNDFCCFCFWAWGRIKNNQKTRIIKPKKIAVIGSPPPCCNKNIVIDYELKLFFGSHLHGELQDVAFKGIMIGIVGDNGHHFMVHAHHVF